MAETERYYKLSLLKSLAYDDDVNGNRDGMIDFTVIDSIGGADVVEVIRCKKCIFYFPPFCNRPINKPSQTHAIMPDHYCGYDERRTTD